MHNAIIWFRQDLRLRDNPALTAAATCKKLTPLYIHAPEENGDWPPGAASNWWLHQSLETLQHSLQQQYSSTLIVRQGPSREALEQLIAETGATHIYWNRLYEPALIERDRQLRQWLQEQGLTVKSFNASLLYEPWQLLKSDDSPYRVFTPYWKAMQRRGIPPETLPLPGRLPPPPDSIEVLPLSALALLPRTGWDDGLQKRWSPGEAGALEQLERFATTSLPYYETERDDPAAEATSHLSPHLHFGEISPRQITALLHQYGLQEQRTGLLRNSESYLRQLAWREFAYYLLYHFPHTQSEPFDSRFSGFRWDNRNQPRLMAWQQGRTGIPIVDAGMRELWQNGWMHNRVRMIVASLLTKNLLQHWLHGARWFWDTLVDADLAANTLGWQWTAGCGADAAPYFRIFNPVLQGQKFDPRGYYVRQWVPEISALSDKYLHCPWQAPARELEQAGIELGMDYPEPIVDLKQSRQTALERHQELKQGRGQA